MRTAYSRCTQHPSCQAISEVSEAGKVLAVSHVAYTEPHPAKLPAHRSRAPLPAWALVALSLGWVPVLVVAELLR